jgi:hypothetical protein
MLPSSICINRDFANGANGGASLPSPLALPSSSLRAPVALAIGSSECDWAVIECTKCNESRVTCDV